MATKIIGVDAGASWPVTMLNAVVVDTVSNIFKLPSPHEPPVRNRRTLWCLGSVGSGLLTPQISPDGANFVNLPPMAAGSRITLEENIVAIRVTLSGSTSPSCTVILT